MRNDVFRCCRFDLKLQGIGSVGCTKVAKDFFSNNDTESSDSNSKKLTRIQMKTWKLFNFFRICRSGLKQHRKKQFATGAHLTHPYNNHSNLFTGPIKLLLKAKFHCYHILAAKNLASSAVSVQIFRIPRN
jgi:hypothetical protein